MAKAGNLAIYIKIISDLEKTEKNTQHSSICWWQGQEVVLTVFRLLMQCERHIQFCIALPNAEFFHRTLAGRTAERKTRRERNVGCYELLSVPRHPSSPPSPLTPRICRTTCGHIIRISWRETPPPPHPHSPHCWIWIVFSVLGQKRGWPLFRGLKVLQLNSDSFCDHVRIWSEVIGHL